MAEFYVEKIAQTTGEHFVHNASCTQLPSKDTLLYVSSTSTAKSAMSSANKLFPHIGGCPNCIAA